MAKQTSSRRAKSAATRGGQASRARRKAPVTIRHYCQGIGDCHLLRFAKDDGSVFTILIDCGVHSAVEGGSKTIESIVADIAKTTNRKIDLLVVTHEHWDHVSGFHTAFDAFSQIEFGELWMAWTENPRDAEARKIDTFKEKTLAVLNGAALALGDASPDERHLLGLGAGLRSLLGFSFGAKGERVRAARDKAITLARDNVRYLEPKTPPLPLEGLDNVRVYVLGPPRDVDFFRIRERKGEMYGASGFRADAMVGALGTALGLDDDLAEPDAYAWPFDPNIGLPLDETLDVIAADSGNRDGSAVDELHAFLYDHYCGPVPGAAPGEHADQEWRRIDQDWLGLSADLAMQLDSKTNNTCLVLAFEFVDTGRVLLFPADAQAGNWLSWQDLEWGKGETKVTGPDLLARTVYYKVGHHGSHNATLKDKGLELMDSPDLAAFIPTNKADAKKVGWGEMPFKPLLDELATRTKGRVIRADDKWLTRDDVPSALARPSGAIRKVTHDKAGLWVELEIG